jgi:hypothetical protein
MLAQDLNEIQNEAGLSGVGTNLGGIISDNLKYVFGIAGLLLLIYMISGGIQLMFSRGDPKAVQAAQGKITNALIGFLVVVFAYAISDLLGQVFDIDQLNQIFGGRSIR